MKQNSRWLLHWLICEKRIFWRWPVDLDWNDKDYLKYPILPLVLSFIILFAIVVVLDGFNTDQQHTLISVINWFFLLSYILLFMIFIYKKKWLHNLSQLLKDKIIDEEVYQAIRKSLSGYGAFLVLIIIFEIAFYFAWFFNPLNSCQEPRICIDKSTGLTDIISYVVIAVIVIPIGTRCFAILLEIAFLPWRLTKVRININIFHSDKKGGLEPIVNLLLYGAAYVSGGIVLTYYLYSDLFKGENLVYYGSIFIFLNIFIFYFPQIHIYTILSKKRNEVLNILHKKIAYWYNKLIDINDPQKQTENAEKYSNHASPYQNTRDEINRMQIWPFDLNSSKFIIQFTLSGLLLLVPSLADYIEVFRKLFLLNM
jgi:hypothetical protein